MTDNAAAFRLDVMKIVRPILTIPAAALRNEIAKPIRFDADGKPNFDAIRLFGLPSAEPVKAKRKALDSAVPKSDHMTVAQAANYLNITDDQVRGFASDGSLQWINVGRGEKRPRYRFLKSELDRFIADRTTQEAAQCPSTPRRSTKASTSSTSSSKVIGLMDRRDALLAAKRKSTKL